MYMDYLFVFLYSAKKLPSFLLLFADINIPQYLPRNKKVFMIFSSEVQ